MLPEEKRSMPVASDVTETLWRVTCDFFYETRALLGQCLLQVVNQVFGVLESDGNAHRSRLYARPL
jgi:hypothetical protein